MAREKKSSEDPLAEKVPGVTGNEEPQNNTRPVKESAKKGMKISFTVDTGLFQKALSFVKETVKRGNTLPVLDNCLCSIEMGDKLKIRTTDLEVDTSILIPIESVKGTLDEFLFDCHGVDKIVQLCDANILEINFMDGDMVITEGFNTYKFNGNPDPDEFPRPADLGEEDQNVTIPFKDLASHMKDAIGFCGVDEIRLVLTGIFMEGDGETVGITSTDAHKLFHFDLPCKSDTFSVIMPQKFVTRLLDVAKSEEEISISILNKGTNILFKTDKYIVSGRLIEGKYPNWRAVCPTDNPFMVTWNRKELSTNIKKLNAIDGGSTNQVRVCFKNGETTFNRMNMDKGTSGVITMKHTEEGEYEDEDKCIGFNSMFLYKGVSVMSEENIKCKMSKPNKAAVLGEDMHYFILLMPVMLNK